MRYAAVTNLALTLAVGACQPASQALTDSQRAAITAELQAAVTSLFDAMNAHDAERLLGHYLNDEDFAYVGCTVLRLGWEGYATMARMWHRAHPEVTFEHEILHSQVIGPGAAVVTVEGSSTQAPYLMWSLVFTRGNDGAWLIAQEHESWPDCGEPPPPHPMTGMP